VLRKSLLLTLALALTGCWTKKPESPSAPRASKGIFVPHRIALVIGNANYSGQRELHNTLYDAADMADAFEKLGFDVILEKNTTMREMDKAVVRFLARIKKDDLAFFYFSGHGMAVDEENYLLPVDFSPDPQQSMDQLAYRASKIRDEMDRSGAQLRVMVLDACRNNPYAKGKGDEGLKTMGSRQAEGTLIAFATNDGNVARETDGRNSLYTGYLLEALRDPKSDLERLLHNVAVQVYDASGKRQFPYLHGSVAGEFYFKDPPAPSGDAAREAWNLVKDSGRRDLLEGFLKEYGSSEYAGLARIKIQALGAGGPARGEERVNPKDGLTYVWIPPGKFRMGCSEGDTECDDDEKPAHEVEIAKGFWLGESEVTQAAYQKVVGKNPSYHKGVDLPVEQVNWNEAVSYCRAIGGRLPTEAEWEYAARAGSSGARYGDVDRIAWTDANSGGNTHSVKHKDPNAWGLYDMLGNVWEWVEDVYPGTQSRTLRGGSFNLSPRDARSSNRGRSVPGVHNDDLGFRCAWE
jgi:hypothetical protein